MFTMLKKNTSIACYEPALNYNNKPQFTVVVYYYFHSLSIPENERSYYNRTYRTVSVYAPVDNPKQAVDYAMESWGFFADDDLITEGLYYDSLYFVKITQVSMVINKKYWKSEDKN